MSPLAVIGVSHLTAPVGIRERFAFTSGEATAALDDLRTRGGVREAVLLSTCNRTELYVHPGSEAHLDAAEVVLSTKAGELVGGIKQYLYRHEGSDSVRHLYRVAGGLDSLVLGEAEIQGQVKEAYALAEGVPGHPPLAGPVMHRLFQTALAAGGRIRSETPIGEGAASVASVAVEVARKIFGSLSGRQVMILGAGTTAELVVGALERDGIRGLVVCNRTYERAQELAAKLSGKAVHLDDMPFALAETDVLVASTAAPHPLVTLDGFRHAMGRGRATPLLVLDLAIPRDVEPEVGGEANVFLYNVDDLREIVDDNLLVRRASVADAETIVDEYADAFVRWNDARDVVPVIQNLRGRWDAVRQRELDRLLHKMEHMSADDRKAVEAFSKTLVNKLLHQPTVRLREGAGNGRGAEFIDAVRYLHDLGDAGPELATESQQELDVHAPKDVDVKQEYTETSD